jgi:RNA polymerase sigma-70 factor (ECF subfamily)
MRTPSEQEFRKIYEENQALVFKVCRMYADSEADFEDNVQEVGLQLWRSFGNFKGKSKISTWMYRVALNVCMSQLRKKKKQEKVKQSWPDYAPVEDPEGEVVMSERRQSLSEAIKELGEVDRAVILLYLEEQSYQDISEIMGMTVNNVGVRINRIRNKLKEIIHG